MNDKELELIKRAVMIICRNVRPDGDLYFDFEDSCTMQEIYDKLVKGGADTMSYDKRYCDTCKHNVGYPKSVVCQGCGDFNHYEKGCEEDEIR